jgi:hypothetical protein
MIKQIQHKHFTHNLITTGMDGEHDDVHLNITQLLAWDIHICRQIKIHFIHICNKNMYENPHEQL